MQVPQPIVAWDIAEVSADGMTRPATPLRPFARAFTNGAASLRAWRALVMLLVVVVSCFALTPTPLEGSESPLDKVGHLMAFSALAFAGYFGFSTSRGMRAALLFGLLAYGGLIEVLQLFVPGRSSEWGDLIADAIGIASGAGLAALVLRAGSAAELPR
jgi:VanZ family protein